MKRIMRRASALLIILSVLVAGCGDSSPAAPSANVPFAVIDLTLGMGAAAANGQVLTVDYIGWLYDSGAPDNKGVVFDSSVGRPSFVFTLGVGQVIRGWHQGLVGMQVGGERRLVIPPELGYGQAGSGNAIPPNATLIFDVTLVRVQ
jgi:FKBP-type peptidyl-prolyl cis-trans isomerase FkpA